MSQEEDTPLEDSQRFDWTRVVDAMTECVKVFDPETSAVAGRKHIAFPGAVLLVGLEGRVCFSSCLRLSFLAPRAEPSE